MTHTSLVNFISQHINQDAPFQMFSKLVVRLLGSIVHMISCSEIGRSQVEVPDRKSICPDRNERTRWRRAFKITRSGKKMNAR